MCLSVCLAMLNCYLAATQPTLGHYPRICLTHPMLITISSHFQPQGYWDPHNRVGFLSQLEPLVDFEPGFFQFWLQHLNPLDHCLQKIKHGHNKSRHGRNNFFKQKSSVTDHLFLSFFEVKNQNEPIAIKMHTQKILLVQLNLLLLVIRCGKIGMEK